MRVRGIEEPSPDPRDVAPGYFAPPPELVVGNEWRLIPPLGAVAAGGSSLPMLISAAAAQVQQELSASIGGKGSLGDAFDRLQEVVTAYCNDQGYTVSQ